MKTPAAALRFWRQSREYRNRYGLLDGWRIANEIADLSYRKVNRPFAPISVPGWPQPFWLRSNTTDIDVFRQVIVAGELDLDLSPPPRRIIDGGANIGTASRVFANRWPDAEIVAVELEPGNVAALRRNCEMLPQVHVRWAALWDVPGTIGIDPAGYGELGFRVSLDAAGIRVPAIPLEDLLDELDWDTVDLVKLDIEGAERQVLATAPRWIHRVNHFVVELHDRFAPGCADAFEAAFDRRQWRVRPHGEYLVASKLPAA